MAALVCAEPDLFLRLLSGLKVASPGRELPTTTITRHLSVFTYGRFWLDCLPTRNCWMCLGGGQVAVLRLHAAVSLPRNDCTILAELGERVTQLQNLLLARSFQALRSLGNSVNTPRMSWVTEGFIADSSPEGMLLRYVSYQGGQRCRRRA